MADFVFNISKGRVAELVNRVNNNDPAASTIGVLCLKTAGLGSDAVLKDCVSITALLAQATEATNVGYARKVLADGTTGLTVTTDQSADLVRVFIPDQTWTAPAVSGGAWSKLVVYYSPADATSAGDSANIPLTGHDFVVTPDTNDIIADFSATLGSYSAA